MSLKKTIYKQVLRNRELSLASQKLESEFVFHGHEAGDCTKRIFLRHTNVPPIEDTRDDNALAELYILFSDGFRHQESVVSLLKQCPNIQVTNEEEGRFIKHPTASGTYIFVSGHPDAIVYNAKTKQRLVLEVKGLNHFACAKLKDEDIDTLKATYPTAIPQARIYSRMYETDGAIVVVKNKNTSKLYEFTLPRNTKAEDKILSKFAKVYEQICRSSAPKCDYLKGDPKCKYCPYPDSCGD